MERGIIMADYATMYRKLFNAQTDAIQILQTAQQQTEEIYADSPEPDLKMFESENSVDKPEK